MKKRIFAMFLILVSLGTQAAFAAEEELNDYAVERLEEEVWMKEHASEIVLADYSELKYVEPYIDFSKINKGWRENREKSYYDDEMEAYYEAFRSEVRSENYRSAERMMDAYEDLCSFDAIKVDDDTPEGLYYESDGDLYYSTRRQMIWYAIADKEGLMPTDEDLLAYINETYDKDATMETFEDEYYHTFDYYVKRNGTEAEYVEDAVKQFMIEHASKADPVVPDKPYGMD